MERQEILLFPEDRDKKYVDACKEWNAAVDVYENLLKEYINAIRRWKNGRISEKT